MKNVNTNIKNIYNMDLKGTNALLNIKVNLFEMRSNLMLILDPKNKKDFQANKDAITSIKAKNDMLVADYKTTITTDLDRQQFAEFEKLFAQYRDARDELIKDVGEGDYVKANEIFATVTKLKIRYSSNFR